MSDSASEVAAGDSVVDANGQEIGTVVGVEDGTPIVEPGDQLTDSATRALGWHGDQPHRLYDAHVDAVADAAIHLKSNL